MNMAADPIALWERLAAAPPAVRGSSLLQELEIDPASVTLGQGLRFILDLRAALVGQTVDGFAICPECDEANTVIFDHADLADATVPPDLGILHLEWQDYSFALRMLTPDDLAAAGSARNLQDAEAILRLAVLVKASCGCKFVSSEEIPSEAWQAIEKLLEQADELSDPRLTLTCQFCDVQWNLALDIPDILGRELEQIVRTQLSEVAELACTFGWSEPEVLALSPARRRLYLQMARDELGGAL